ncbi:fatty acid desaturase [Geminicoccus roseus]|uniref:fatty acid desaturase n=1 Tax=Geminicoccus roseus TaxID=404900 RepID=UPI000402803E|nr:fatty acid desaturase [Geminicoccus roseus]
MDDSIDHRAMISRLAPEQRRALTTLSDRPGLVQLAGHLGLILVLGWAILAGVPGWPLLLVPQGILIVFLFTALHETVHGTAFRTPWLNRAVAHLAGFLVLIPPCWFKYFHFAHHRHTHDPDHDPELMAPKPETVLQYLRYLSGVPLWISAVRTLLTNARGAITDDYLPRRARPQMVVEARVMLGLYALLAAGSVAFGSTALWWAWLAPILLGQPFLRAYLLAEHTRCPHVANMLENTRTTFTTRVVRFVAWNMPYHAEHHAYPTVPFHQLPALHEHARAYLRQTERGYARFHQKLARALAGGG